MQRIDTTTHLFSDGDPQNNIKGTKVSATWLNAIQEELATVIEAAGITLKTPETETNDQLLAAILAAITAALGGASDSGDMLFASAVNTFARLGKGLANSKMFMDAAGAYPEWGGGINTYGMSRVLSLASADIPITGVGFKPVAVIAWSGIDTSYSSMSFGFAFESSNYCVYQANSGLAGRSGSSLSKLETSSGNFVSLAIKTYDSDGVTITFTKTGSPPAIDGYYNFLFFR